MVQLHLFKFSRDESRMDLYTINDLLLDPAFEDPESFRAYYDYDLVGTPIGLGKDFLRNPANYLRSLILKYKLELILGSALIFLSYFSIVIIKGASRRPLRLFAVAFKLWQKGRKIKKEIKLRNIQCLPPDSDLQARAIYCALTDFYGIRSGNEKNQTFLSDPDYEANRFALEAAWLTEHGLRVLDEADPLRSFNDEPIEGAAEDEELEKILEEMQLMEASDESVKNAERETPENMSSVNSETFPYEMEVLENERQKQEGAYDPENSEKWTDEEGLGMLDAGQDDDREKRGTLNQNILNHSLESRN